ncbi:MerR family transcriptional regulator, redox-sensitive transcriptional activator SoxR [Geodermatophilus dictyosporus]|uniref:MerR family transcriptional regulator, redox-sensitive transcriptional activator SoxR n=1 Tax=Geodermatophilus dictyosporus TaxID=1523247 RepID=A0A1I5N4G1_9ACTN|nr:redox-sensitive transcriptional activator SoxR [Geodermatophilus dictyosporus]SFP16653.1 MerR family transcriptional regulator, redox-sensitive transcriptional activator SoxR [Geodermatophilus dictyosporus]
MEGLTIGEVAARAGLAPSALRYYEAQGLVTATRTAGGARRFPRSVLRRLAFVRAAQNVGLSLPEIRAALATLPDGRTPSARDWARLSRGWRDRLDAQIAALEQLRDGLSSCIGCGCLSLTACALSNPGDSAATEGTGARRLAPLLRRTPPGSNAVPAPRAPRRGGAGSGTGPSTPSAG